MRNPIVLLVVTFVISSCSGVLAPDPVHRALMEKYKDAKNVKWEQDGQNWEAEFDLGNMHLEVEFSEDGKWLETEWDVEMMDLPPLVRDSLAVAYKDYKIQEVQRYETPGFKGYVIVVEKGETELELIANENEIIKSSEEVDAEAEDDQDMDEDHDHDEGHEHDDDGDSHDHDDDDHDHDHD